MVMIKDNHIAAAGGIPQAVAGAEVRAAPHSTVLQCTRAARWPGQPAAVRVEAGAPACPQLVLECNSC